MNVIKQGVEFSHQLLNEHIKQGSVVIDATAGNGLDTIFLTRLVGAEGKVYAFDIQELAIKQTQERLDNLGFLAKKVRLIHDGHQNMAKYIITPVQGILFNLGYLPGGDKEIVTRPETTIMAVETGLNLLEIQGLIVLVLYPGHPVGRKEARELINYCSSLDGQRFNVLHYHFLNQSRPPAEVIAIKKRR